MNRAEAIKELDKAITSLTSQFNAYDGSNGKSMKKIFKVCCKGSDAVRM